MALNNKAARIAETTGNAPVMFRLSFLLLATIAGIYAALMILGGENLRAERILSQPVAVRLPEPVALPEAAAMPDMPEQAAEPLPQPEQTPERAPRFPGPALERSPEFAGRDPQTETPAPAAPDGPALWVTANRLNMRAAPDTAASVVTGLDGGTRLEPLAPEQDGWVNVRAPGGQTGYVSAQFVSDQPQ
ncbi:SH3 domain-containing protein [Paracoccus bogoriensis]|uniref:SH3 domain-containing protein n=1 Tax=Paracoccus bogoriensis TaxID=242065 RepID=UPI001C66FF06|nr:SH3 domain-containing protein [Paracoccus bogoriensis]MBW7056865.1 SH3 domain-containing protein [Paracoccus bogoriensis]